MKTYTIESHYCRQERRINSVMLCRRGRAVKTIVVKDDAEKVAAHWDLRKLAAELGGTHVRLADTGGVERTDR